MTNKNTSPFSLRLTHKERETLDQMAGNMPLGTYIRIRLLNDPTPRKRIRRITKDEKELTRILAFLSTTEIPTNLYEISNAIRNNTITVTEETEIQIQAACSALQSIQNSITKALGFNEKNKK